MNQLTLKKSQISLLNTITTFLWRSTIHYNDDWNLSDPCGVGSYEIHVRIHSPGCCLSQKHYKFHILKINSSFAWRAISSPLSPIHLTCDAISFNLFFKLVNNARNTFIYKLSLKSVSHKILSTRIDSFFFLKLYFVSF